VGSRHPCPVSQVGSPRKPKVNGSKHEIGITHSVGLAVTGV
jgi:hypothetical protein